MVLSLHVILGSNNLPGSRLQSPRAASPPAQESACYRPTPAALHVPPWWAWRAGSFALVRVRWGLCAPPRHERLHCQHKAHSSAPAIPEGGTQASLSLAPRAPGSLCPWGQGPARLRRCDLEGAFPEGLGLWRGPTRFRTSQATGAATFLLQGAPEGLEGETSPTCDLTERVP